MEKRFITRILWRFYSLETVRRFFVFAFASLLTCSAFANPVVDNVAAGTVSIQQTESTTTINQTSSKAIINWQSFNIGASESTHFQQPAGGVALNRINPQRKKLNSS